MKKAMIGATKEVVVVAMANSTVCVYVYCVLLFLSLLSCVSWLLLWLLALLFCPSSAWSNESPGHSGRGGGGLVVSLVHFAWMLGL